MEVSFRKPNNFYYEAGQFVMIAIPSLAFSQFHPFTVSSSPHQGTVTLHIKVLGRWTRKLSEIAEKHEEVSFLMEGPYGRLMVELENRERYKMMLMISGGIGVTPMQSLTNELLYEAQSDGRELKKLHFVWAIRSLEMLQAMKDTGNEITSDPSIYGKNDLAKGVFEFSLYLTRKNINDDTAIDNIENALVGNSDINLRQGRPDLDQTFQKMKKAAVEEGERYVAVCVCGPRVMVDACRDASRRYSDRNVQFDFHEETFDL